MDRSWVLGGVLQNNLGATRAVSYRPKLTPESSVLLIGDSFANGMRPHFQAIASDSRLPFLGAAVTNSTIEQWASSNWLRDKLDSFAPSHVLIVLGTVDAYSDRPVSLIERDAEALNDVVHEYQAHPIWIGTPPLPTTYATLPLNVEVTAALEELAPFYFDSTLDIPRGPDQLHPNVSGYAGWAGMVWQWLS